MACLTEKEAVIEALFDDRGMFSSDDESACEMNFRGECVEEVGNVPVDNIQQIVRHDDGSVVALETPLSGCSLSMGGQGPASGSTSGIGLQSCNEWIPVEGMVVENVVEAFIKYSEYARRVGFEVRFRSTELSSSGKKALEDSGVDIIPRKRTNRGIGRFWLHDGYKFCSKVRLQCVKGEKLRPNRKNPERPVLTQATSCKAGIYLVKIDDGRWELRKVSLDHNHECDHSSTRFMRNYRIVSGLDELQIVTGDKAGVTPSRGYMNFVVGNGGIENVPFSLKDSHSVVRRWRMKGMENGDFNAMQKIFNGMKGMSDDFFYAYDTDVEGRVKNVFWADARSRAAYCDFGDVLCFDTTHLKNRYKMPLAPFIGVNHHGQSILLGCALLSKEDVGSFKWVFETWLSCMRKIAPKYIMMDQCQAIGSAVAAVFPNSRHRLCLWHIMKNGELHLRGHRDWTDIRKDFSNIVHGCCDAEEFEGMWSDFIAKYGLAENEWLTKMFDMRDRWVPAFFLHEFWAGLHSTQRSEGINNFFRSYVNINTGLKQFAEQYCLAVGKRVDDEEREDWKSKNKLARCATVFKCEKIFQRFYTLRKFIEFQNEAKAVGYVNTEIDSFDGVNRIHMVTDKCARTTLGHRGTKNYAVSFTLESKRSRCDCKMFEFKGIICRHIIAVWQFEEVNDIPDEYIIDRWRKDIFRRSSIVKIPNYTHAFCRSDEVIRCEKLQGSMRQLTDMAMTDDAICKVVLEDLHALNEKCKRMLEVSVDNVRVDSLGRQYRKCQTTICNLAPVTPVVENGVLDPIDRRGKGRVPVRRKGGGKKRKRGKVSKVARQLEVGVLDDCGGDEGTIAAGTFSDGGHNGNSNCLDNGRSIKRFHIFL